MSSNTVQYEPLFSYGTLQDDAVQLSTFGRKLDGVNDVLLGYVMGKLEITDPYVLATSQQTYHPVLDYSGNTNDCIAGKVFQITLAELVQADIYEEEAYERIKVTLKSGTDAWVYVRKV